MNIEYDIKEILSDIKQSFDKIDARFDKIDARFDRVTADVSDLKTELVRVDLGLKGQIKALDEKIDGLAKWVDTQEFINRGVIIGLVLAILGGFAKIFSSRNL